MICQKCGNNNPDGASFCRFCGNRLRNEGDPNTPNMAHARPQVPAYGQPQASDYVQPQTPDYVQPQAPGYGQPQAPGYGQPQAPGYGQPQAAGYGQPQAPGYGQPQAPGYGGAGAYGSGPRMGSAYTDPYGRSPYGAAPDGRAYPAPGTSRPVSRWLIAVIAEAAVLLMVLVIASTLFHQAGSVDRKAGKYFVSLVNGNYKKAFSYLNLKKDKFINPDQLELAMGGTDFSEVDNYYIQDYKQSIQNKETTNQTKWIGLCLRRQLLQVIIKKEADTVYKYNNAYIRFFHNIFPNLKCRNRSGIICCLLVKIGYNILTESFLLRNQITECLIIHEIQL